MRSQDNLRFGVQVIFSSIVLLFCLYKLAIAADNQGSNALYWGGITSILAWWMPSPGGPSRGSISTSIKADEVNAVSIDKLATSAPPVPVNGSKN